MLNRKRTKKEKAYDEKISGLMTQIVKICKENDIAAFCYFNIAGPEDPNLGCTTSILERDSKSEASRQVDALRRIHLMGKHLLSDHVPMQGNIGKAIYNPEYISRDEMKDILK